MRIPEPSDFESNFVGAYITVIQPIDFDGFW